MTVEAKSVSASARVRSRLEELGLRVQKGFGQNFLIDRSVLRDIVAASELSSRDVVVEVGPGLGMLTEELARVAGRVVAVEVDRGLADGLKAEFQSRPNVLIINGDILSMSPESLLERSWAEAKISGYKVVANLPYNITSPIIRHFLEADCKPRLMVVMVQKEVGKSITAEVGGMNLLGVAVQFYARPRIVRKVPGQAFYPVPRVDSVVLKLDIYDKPSVGVTDTGVFFRVVKAGFSARRKQIHNSLAQGLKLPPSLVVNMLGESGIDPRRRAETLTLKEWAIISERFRRYVNGSSTGQIESCSGSIRQAC